MTNAARALLNAHVSEREFQRDVMAFARLHGWTLWRDNATNARRKCPHCGEVVHQPRNQAGWPDLVCLRGGRFVAAELKAEDGRLTPAQREWLELLGHVPGIETYVWRPSTWGEIEAILGKGATR